MKHLMKIAMAALVLAGTSAYATDKPHEDAQKMASQTVKTQTVKYTCQSGKKVAVKYGFNKQNLPTYAESNLNGKTRFMPINLHLSDNVATQFGDENNFSLSGSVIEKSGVTSLTAQNIKKANIGIQSPDGEILFKDCSVAKGKKR